MLGQVSEVTLKEQATARAAEERHMEILNLASGKLDCEYKRRGSSGARLNASRRRSARSRDVPPRPALESSTLCLSHIIPPS